MRRFWRDEDRRCEHTPRRSRVTRGQGGTHPLACQTASLNPGATVRDARCLETGDPAAPKGPRCWLAAKAARQMRSGVENVTRTRRRRLQLLKLTAMTTDTARTRNKNKNNSETRTKHRARGKTRTKTRRARGNDDFNQLKQFNQLNQKLNQTTGAARAHNRTKHSLFLEKILARRHFFVHLRASSEARSFGDPPPCVVLLPRAGGGSLLWTG